MRGSIVPMAFAGAAIAGRRLTGLGHNLLLRPGTRKPDVLCFLTDPAVRLTYNLAEQDGRRVKLRQKIAGGCSHDGAKDFAIVRPAILNPDCERNFVHRVVSGRGFSKMGFFRLRGADVCFRDQAQ